MKIGRIYLVQSPSGKCYVGQTYKKLPARISNHYWTAFNFKNKRATNSKIARALRKYPKEDMKWVILKDNILEEDMDIWERYYIFIFNSLRSGYNGNEGGSMEGCRGYKHSEETKKKLSKMKKGYIPSEETRLKLSIANKGHKPTTLGRKHTPEEIQKMKDNRPSYQGKNNPFFGKKHSEETKSKMKCKKIKFIRERCSLCDRPMQAKKLCKMHYQIMRRAKNEICS